MLLDAVARRDRLPPTEDQVSMAPETPTIAPGQLHGGLADRPEAIPNPRKDDDRQCSTAELEPIHSRPTGDSKRAAPEPQRRSRSPRVVESASPVDATRCSSCSRRMASRGRAIDTGRGFSVR